MSFTVENPFASNVSMADPPKGVEVAPPARGRRRAAKTAEAAAGAEETKTADAGETASESGEETTGVA